VYTTFRDPVLSISVLLPDQIRAFMHIYSGLEIVLEHIVAVWKRVFFFHTTDRAIFRGAYPRSLDRAAFRYAHFCAIVRARSRFRCEAAGHTAALLHLVKVVRIELAIYEVYPLNFFTSLKRAQIFVKLYIYKGKFSKFFKMTEAFLSCVWNLRHSLVPAGPALASEVRVGIRVPRLSPYAHRHYCNNESPFL